MWKFVLVIVVLTLAALFVPRYNLMKQITVGGDEFQQVETGFWTREACDNVGKEFENGYRCVKTSAWRSLMGKQRTYNREMEIE